MKRRVVLHIGAPKTGTSALQVALARRRRELEAVGCHYPTNDDVERAAAGDVTSGNALGMAKFLNPDLRHQLSGSVWLAHFRSLLADTSFEQLVYSSEFLWRVRQENLRTVHDIVADAGFGWRIVAYVRPQDEFAVSQYSQGVKRHQQTRTLDEVVGDADIDFLGTLDRYADVFGSEQMRVRVFDREQFAGGTIFADFATQLDVPLDGLDLDTPEPRINPSLSLQESETMRFLNRFGVSTMVMDQVPSAYRRLRRGASDGDRLALSDELANELREKYRDENARIEDRYLADQTLRFTAPTASERRFPPPSRLFSAAVGMLAAWMSFRRRLEGRWSRWAASRSGTRRLRSGGGCGRGIA